jgi:hypothetical protein
MSVAFMCVLLRGLFGHAALAAGLLRWCGRSSTTTAAISAATTASTDPAPAPSALSRTTATLAAVRLRILLLRCFRCRSEALLLRWLLLRRAAFASFASGASATASAPPARSSRLAWLLRLLLRLLLLLLRRLLASVTAIAWPLPVSGSLPIAARLRLLTSPGPGGPLLRGRGTTFLA